MRPPNALNRLLFDVRHDEPFAEPLVDAGAHPLPVLMSLHVMSRWKPEEK